MRPAERFQLVLILLLILVLVAVERRVGQLTHSSDPEIMRLSVGSDTIPWPYEEIPEGMIPLEGGEFIFGSSRAQKRLGYQLDNRYAKDPPYLSFQQKWYDHEPPAQVREVGPFAIDQYPVTQRDFLSFVEGDAVEGYSGPTVSREEWESFGLIYPYERIQSYQWKDGKPPVERLDHPVVLVSWAEAMTFCKWREQEWNLTHPDGPRLTFRLPTALEYERAARGRGGRTFPWGNSFEAGRANTVWYERGVRKGRNDTAPAEEFPGDQTPEGISQLAGNVFEWTATPWPSDDVWEAGEDYDPGAVDEPAGGKVGKEGLKAYLELLRREGSKRHEVRGASFDVLPGLTRTTARHSRPSNLKHFLLGFRCVAIPERGAQKGMAGPQPTNQSRSHGDNLPSS